jgi:hypothetical protein
MEKTVHKALLITVAILGIATTSPSAHAETKITVVNKSGLTITSVKSKPTYGEDWSNDLIDEDIASGDAADVDIDDGGKCYVSLFANLSGGNTAEYWRFNVCKSDTWNITR